MPGSVLVFSSAVAGALTMGLTCGAGCSPNVTGFLSSYMMNNEEKKAKSFLSFLHFYFGKAFSIAAVCILASVLGQSVVKDGLYFGVLRADFLMPVFLIVSGAFMVVKSGKEALLVMKKYIPSAQKARSLKVVKLCQGGKCSSSCSSENAKPYEKLSPFLGGLVYGLTPCVPLTVIAGYAVNLGIIKSLIVSLVFSTACMVSPLVLVLVFVKLVSGKMKEEVPDLFVASRFILSSFVFLSGFISLSKILFAV